MPIERTSTGLRDHLFKVLEGLERGNKTPQEATAAARVAGQINISARLDQEYARFISDQRIKVNPTLMTILVSNEE